MTLRFLSRAKRISRSILQNLGLAKTTSEEALAFRRMRLATQVALTSSQAKVGIVGCGTMGRDIARAVNMLDGWVVAAVHDRIPDASRKMREEISPTAKIYATLDDLLTHACEYDVLAIATTAPGHIPIVFAALDAGVRTILLEKPVATCLADVDELISVAGEPSITRIAVDHTRRWLPMGQGIKRLVSSGVIGKPCVAHFTFGRAGLAMIGTHYFDFARWIFDADFARLRSELDEIVRPSWRGSEFVDLSGRCEAYLSNGIRFTLDLSDSLRLQQAVYLIIGEHGRLEIDERLGRIRMVGAGGRIWEDQYLWQGALKLGVATALYELHAGKSPRCTLADGRASLEAVIACHLSAREGGRWVELPLEGKILEERFPFA
ncbi:Gfo/Idh/MocA family oxidoreductase [Anaerolineae bacterium CFX7]|nr:Gfo/Idh/MocA family oxidoreductase [Anaerolineae bacterium CFX7]